MSTIIIFLVVIVFLVVAHELGHFFVAKAFKVRVDEFGIGYAPRAKKLFTWKGTLFTLNWLPFGGFVKIFGEESEGEDTTGSFAYAKMWQRILIVAAGIVANTIVAMILYSISFGIGFLGNANDFPGSIAVGKNQTFITGVMENSPAKNAGIMSGDIITSLSSGAENKNPENVNDVIYFIKNHGNESVKISLIRNGKIKNVNVVPAISKTNTTPVIGVALTEASEIRLPFFQSIKMGVRYTISQFGFIFSSLGLLITSSFKGSGSVLSQVSGPVGIAQIAGQAYSLGLGSFFAFIALISVNLAVINLLPFPALDGGRIILEFFSSKGKSRIPAKVISAINQVGFLILILIMLYVTYHDIVRLIT